MHGNLIKPGHPLPEHNLDPPPDEPECPECDTPLESPDGCVVCGWEPDEPDYSTGGRR